MIDTVLFDLDGTLLHFNQDEFIKVYFTELWKVFAKLGLDPELGTKALWKGTGIMIAEGGEKLNSQRFWAAFSRLTGLSGEGLKAAEDACDEFYSSDDFNSVRKILRNADPELPKKIVRETAARGFTVALATNPLFPECATVSRLGWVGLTPQDFKLVTHYANSTYCKPNPGYYHEVFNKLGKTPQQCMMVGNSPGDDMAAGILGAETFLVNEFIENESGLDISKFRSGSLAELYEYLILLPTP